MFTRPRIIPVLLLDDGDLVKTVNFGKRTYLGDPVNAVKIFNRKGIDELVILDIGATKRKRKPDMELLADIASEAFMPLSCGGGITTVEEIRELLAAGYEKVVVNTALIHNPEMIKSAVQLFGSQSIVASIDAKAIRGGYQCMIEDGQKVVKITPLDLAKKAEKLGVGEILINSIDRDGMMNGYDLKLVKEVSRGVKVPVTACGGAKGIQDLKRVIEEGAHAAAGGSMFVFYGKLKAVLITAPGEKELTEAGIYQDTDRLGI